VNTVLTPLTVPVGIIGLDKLTGNPLPRLDALIWWRTTVPPTDVARVNVDVPMETSSRPKRPLVIILAIVVLPSGRPTSCAAFQFTPRGYRLVVVAAVIRLDQPFAVLVTLPPVKYCESVVSCHDRVVAV